MRWLSIFLCASLAACSSEGVNNDEGNAAGGDDGAQAAAGSSGSSGGNVGAAGQVGGGGAGDGRGGGPGVAGAGGGRNGGSVGSAGGGEGGSAGAGDGSVGTDGGAMPPHVVGACDGLGPANRWDTVTPPGVLFVGSVAVDPLHAGTLYVGTGATSGTGGAAQGFQKSTDCGATWTKVSSGRNGKLFDSGTDYGITVDWSDPTIIFSATLYGENSGLLRSTDSGVDWDIMWPPGSDAANAQDFVFAQEFSMDPTDHAHVVSSIHVACKGDVAPMCLAETRDSGATWHMLRGPLKGWGENARAIVLGSKALLFVSWGDGAYYTADSSVTQPVWQKVTPAGGHARHAKNGNWYLASYQGVFRSTDGGQTFTLIPGSPRSYAIETDGQRIFVGGDVANNYHSALESDDTKWQTLSAPSTPDQYITMSYDADHHLLYSANHTTGLIRMVTQ
jgi:hypothetical protein